MLSNVRKYKGYEIIKVFAHGESYYQIIGEKKFYYSLKSTKAEIDKRTKNAD